MCIDVCMDVSTCMFARVYPSCVCMGVCLQVCVVWVYAWMYTYLCLHVCVYTHVYFLLILCHLQGACHSLETQGSLLSIILRLVQNPSEIILITLEATTLRHEAVKCECLQMSAQGSRRTDQGLVTEKCMPVHPSARALAQP